jgi:hypothetical protein
VFRPDRSLALAAALLLGGPAHQDPVPAAAPLTETFPPALPGPLTLAGWEQVRGEASDASHRVVYRFYVDPARRALYRITQYRIVPEKGVAETEKLLWNESPGTRVPLQCYERVAQRDWTTLWLWKRWRWRRLEPGSQRYRREMMTAIRIYNVHRASFDQPEP